MERKLFDWKDWDVNDTMMFSFMDVTLKEQIGPHQIGDKFEVAVLNYEDGLLELYPNKTSEHFSYKIELRIVA